MSFDSEQVNREKLLQTIRDLDFDPEVVEQPPPAAVETKAQVDISKLPEELQALFAQAKQQDRPVLLDFTAPG